MVAVLGQAQRTYAADGDFGERVDRVKSEVKVRRVWMFVPLVFVLVWYLASRRFRSVNMCCRLESPDMKDYLSVAFISEDSNLYFSKHQASRLDKREVCCVRVTFRSLGGCRFVGPISVYGISIRCSENVRHLATLSVFIIRWSTNHAVMKC